MNPVIEVTKLIKEYPEVRAVDNISFSIPQGICFGLLGPNGAGKTTTIEIIEGIQKATSGKILYKGKPRRSQFRQEVGIQLQSTELPHHLTVLETLKMYRDLYRRQAEISELIRMCHLTEILERDNRKISGGQKQRLLLAIALANDPDLVFLDEPTTGLDPQARRHLWDIVNHIKHQNKTIVLTTHYMEEAQILCDIIAIMDRGTIIAMGSPSELLQRYANKTSIILRGQYDKEIFCSMPCEYFQIHDGIEIQTDQLNECMRELIEKNIDLSTITVRSQNLEDLFLKLTGRELRA